MNGQSRIQYTQFSIMLVVVMLLSLLSYYPAQAKKSYTYYVHKTSKLYTTSGKSKQFIRYVPINAKLKTTSKRSSKMVKITYGGLSGYVYRSNLWTKRTTKTRYIRKTSYLYSSRDASKQRIWKIAINKKITTDSNLNYKMYHVNYKGKRGYVYKSNLSSYKKAVVKYVKKKSKQYKNYSRTKRYSGTIPLGTRLETQSPQSNKLFWVSYKGRKSYVYAVNLTNAELSYTYNNAVAENTYGVISTGGNHGIWDQPYGIKDAKSVGKIAEYERVPLNVLRESAVGGVAWYQVSVDGNTLGWIHKDIVQVTSNMASDGSIPYLAVANVKNTTGSLYSAPNASGLVSSLSIYANLKLKIDLVDGDWVHIKKYTAGTSLGWVKASNLSIQAMKSERPLHVNYDATISSSKAPIFDDNGHFVGYSGQFNAGGRTVQINQEKQVENEERYRISYNHHVIGWVISSAIKNLRSATDPNGYRIVNNASAAIYDGQGNGEAPDTGVQIGSLNKYSTRMLEVIKNQGGWSFIKYNDWYGKSDKDIDIGWVENSSLGDIVNKTSEFKSLLAASNAGKQQGLAYDSKRDYYYVGYDLGNGLGKIVAYNRNGGIVKESGLMKLGHACALSYNPADDKLYEVSSAGDRPVLNIIDPDSNGLSILKSTEIRGDIPYVAMMAVKDANTLILLTESFGDDSFFTYNLKTGELSKRHSMQKMGVVQGLQYEDGKLYFLANNYLTVLDDSWTITDRFRFSIPDGAPQESEGLTMGTDENGNKKLVIGFADHNLYIEQ
ncbi:GW domain-containing glycosaminoglycan-binding protein [Sporolactobacillus shoreicorticis]|uniref:GW domain-containing glycosaminoglycan-binding protein n=1 Tax=Sporolactobacillus shoreicorticis TaxID=1923877 RepID=A0ABW5S626_9BACL|nr:GW domain-containing glycosaminoglycan-binding protein [Sporolactobacillus shoreicorticis]MCO7127184.1 GW domain-containing glycosaminoglycan-binding protein [Sporolactobacillus shoreicorticis]